MTNINNINLPTTLKNFTELVKQNEQILYNDIANHINNNADRHTASDIIYNGSVTVEQQIQSMLQTISNIQSNLTTATQLLTETQSLADEAQRVAATKTSTTINGKYGDVILKQGAGIIISEEVETGGAVFTINNTISGGVVVTGNTGRQFTYTINLASVVSDESIPNLDLMLVDAGVKLQASVAMKVYDPTNGTTVLQSIPAGAMTTVEQSGILRVTSSVAQVSIYIPRVV